MFSLKITLLVVLSSILIMLVVPQKQTRKVHKMTEGEKSRLKELVNSDITITEENLDAPCKFPPYCFYICDKERVHKADDVIKIQRCRDLKQPFWMRVNIKPVDESCSTFRFAVAAKNILTFYTHMGDIQEIMTKQYVAIGIKEKDSDMRSALAVLCSPKTSVKYGLIVGRQQQYPVEFESKRQFDDLFQNWSEHPPDDPHHNIDSLKTFYSCEFTLQRKYLPFTNSMGHVDFAQGDFHLLMAFGLKIYSGKDMFHNYEPLPKFRNLSFPTDDHHVQKGYSSTQLYNNPQWIKCQGSSISKPSFFGINILLLTILFY